MFCAGERSRGRRMSTSHRIQGTMHHGLARGQQGHRRAAADASFPGHVRPSVVPLVVAVPVCGGSGSKGAGVREGSIQGKVRPLLHLLPVIIFLIIIYMRCMMDIWIMGCWFITDIPPPFTHPPCFWQISYQCWIPWLHAVTTCGGLVVWWSEVYECDSGGGGCFKGEH